MNPHVQSFIETHGYYGSISQFYAGWEACQGLWPSGVDWIECSQDLATAAQAWDWNDLGLDIWDAPHAHEWAAIRTLLAQAPDLGLLRGGGNADL